MNEMKAIPFPRPVWIDSNQVCNPINDFEKVESQGMEWVRCVIHSVGVHYYGVESPKHVAYAVIEDPNGIIRIIESPLMQFIDRITDQKETNHER